MKKFVSAILSSLLITGSAFASSSLAEIMANHQELTQTLGAKKAIEKTINDLVDNNIPDSEIKEYLSQELSPRDFAKVSKALNKGITSQEEISNLVLNIGDGANFKAEYCRSGVDAFVTTFGVLIAIMAAKDFWQNRADGNKDTARRNLKILAISGVAAGLTINACYDANQ